VANTNTSRPTLPIGPDCIAVLYRDLRKAHEDCKDEPGASDFYYGEMEMRRHDPPPHQQRSALSCTCTGCRAATDYAQHERWPRYSR
jgi:hypothetical protein